MAGITDPFVQNRESDFFIKTKSVRHPVYRFDVAGLVAPFFGFGQARFDHLAPPTLAPQFAIKIHFL